MSAYILNLQKDLLVQMMNKSPEHLLQLVLKEESNSILEMNDSELKEISFPSSTKTTRQGFLDRRQKFWEKEFEENRDQVLDSIFLILKDKIKIMPQNFDYVHKLLIEENIH